MGDSPREHDADCAVGFSNAIGDFFGRETFDKTQSKYFTLFVAEFSHCLLKLKLFLVAGKCLAG